jgi:NADH:ubiquinone oxidoreductase subunit 2 (subunit N)
VLFSDAGIYLLPLMLITIINNKDSNLMVKIINITYKFLFLFLFFNCIILAYLLSAPESNLFFAGSLYKINFYTQFLKVIMIILAVGFLHFIQRVNNKFFELPVLILLALAFSITMSSSNNLALLFICLEGFSLILYIMATISRLQGGIKSAAKYFAFGTGGSILIF